MPTWDSFRRRAAILAALVALPGCAATTGTIRGTVPIAPPDRPGDAVVYLETFAGSSPAVARPAPTIGQRGHRFIPHVLPIARGTTVRFVNRDRVYHNVFSVSPVRTFDTGPYAPGRVREVTFDEPGVVQLFCELDRAMTGFVFVAPTSWFVTPDARGLFELRGLPLGEYEVHAWHPTRGRTKRKVELRAAVAQVRLGF